MKQFFSAILLVFLFQASFAQLSLHPQLDFGVALGLKENGTYKIDNDDMYAASVRAKIMLDITSKLSVGAGVGLDGYHYPSYNTLPVFASVQYFPLKLLKFYAFSNIGYSPELNTFTKGMLFDIGAGYRLMFKKHFGLNFAIYYNLKQFKETFDYGDYQNPSTFKINDWRHSLSAGIGFVF